MNYGAWTALGGAAGTGVDAFQRAKQAKAAALAQKEQADLDKRLKEAQIENLGAEASMLRGGGYSLGQLLGLDPSDPRSRIPVNPKAAPGIVAQGIGAAKPSAEEAQSVVEAKQLGALGQKLGEQWQGFGFQKGTGQQAAAGMAASVLPSSISQRVVGPEYQQFEDTKSILSEIALRQATGAAAPESEKRQYASYLPSPGDSPEVAKNKVDNFFGRVAAKAEQTASRLEAQGLGPQAQYYRANVLKQLQNQRQQMLQMFGGPAQPKTPQAPAGGFDPAAEAARIQQRRKAQGR